MAASSKVGAAFPAQPMTKVGGGTIDVAAIPGWRFPVGYGITVEPMHVLGLHVSEPRSPQETDRLFAEPGLFVVNSAGQIEIIDMSNAPFARLDLAGILRGVKLIQERHYPNRGTRA